MDRQLAQQTEILASSGLEELPFLPSAGGITVPAGYAALGFDTSDDNSDSTTLAELAAKVLEEPLLMQQLSDRVYELMQEDLRQQQERRRNYGRSF